MQDFTRENKLVHVFKHSFRPSPPTVESIAQFIKPGKTLPRFLFWGSKEVAVDLLDYNAHAFQVQENQARSMFTSQHESIYLSPKVRMGAIASGAVRLAVMPTEASKPSFGRAINTLDGIHSVLPPIPATTQHYLYIDIPTGHIVEVDEARVHLSEMRRALASKTLHTLFSATPEDITGQDGMRTIMTPASTLEVA